MPWLHPFAGIGALWMFEILFLPPPPTAHLSFQPPHSHRHPPPHVLRIDVISALSEQYIICYKDMLNSLHQTLNRCCYFSVFRFFFAKTNQVTLIIDMLPPLPHPPTPLPKERKEKKRKLQKGLICLFSLSLLYIKFHFWTSILLNECYKMNSNLCGFS